MRTILLLASLAVLAAGAGAAFIYSGTYDIGADVPHWPLVFEAIDEMRDRSIEVHSREVQQVPNLQDPQLLAEGAEHYSAMCTGCHLAPGMEETEIRAGLYPQPPDLTQHNQGTPAEQFWVIKHGAKLTAMPAWGKTHDDDAIWGLVAFIQQLPGMTPEAYAAATGNQGQQGGHHHHHDGGSDGDADSERHDVSHDHRH